MQQTALAIVQKLQSAGHIAYYAGGAVRDFLLGIEPEDIDIATSAKPEQIEALFAKTYAVGKHFGVITVEEGGHHFEIATFRSDGGYSDGRRPNAILFTDAKEDAERRDFTINALFYDPVTKQIHDFVGGQADLKTKTLRFIGDPETRIREDHLRLLRAVRFKNRFGLDFAPEIIPTLQMHASLILSISAERIREELTKMLLHSSRSQAFRDLVDWGLLEHIIPEFTILQTIPQPENYHAEGDALIHSLLAASKLPPEPNSELAWATLFHDIGKAPTISYFEERIRFLKHDEAGEKVAREVLKRLKFSRFSIGKITWLIRHHHLFDQWEEMKWTTKLHYFDHPFFEDLLTLHRADLFGCIPALPSFHLEGEEQLQQIRTEYERAHFDNLLPSAQPELLSGEEIMTILNAPAGKEIGTIKATLREKQLTREIQNKEAAEQWLKETFVAHE